MIFGVRQPFFSKAVQGSRESTDGSKIRIVHIGKCMTPRSFKSENDHHFGIFRKLTDFIKRTIRKEYMCQFWYFVPEMNDFYLVWLHVWKYFYHERFYSFNYFITTPLVLGQPRGTCAKCLTRIVHNKISKNHAGVTVFLLVAEAHVHGRRVCIVYFSAYLPGHHTTAHINRDVLCRFEASLRYWGENILIYSSGGRTLIAWRPFDTVMIMPIIISAWKSVL